ncbi:MAG: response regulator transcription factor [Cyclobacteriaceae bacterium]|nr:response regulator transcription factor [Cyclobacteriaceae bacterium]
MGQAKARVVIVEDNTIVREGFTFLVSSNPKFVVVNTYDNAEDAIRKLTDDQPVVILMDIALPGMNGIKAISEIKKVRPSVHILIISVHEESEVVFEALCAGATGYLTKTSNYDRVTAALEEIINGGSPMSSQIARMVVSSFARNQRSPLSPRETEILTELATGKSYTRIADQLFLSKDTIRTHIRNIYAKLQVSSKADAIALAKSERLI